MSLDFADAVKVIVDAAPPLSDDQRVRLRALLCPESSFDPNASRRAPIDTSRRPPPIQRVALYRHYDADGVLLYVGISSDPKTRAQTHRRHSAWTEFAARETAEWLADRDAAEAAEKAAITAEKPLFNGQHTTAEAQMACVEYLVKRGRTDLLRFGGPRG